MAHTPLIPGRTIGGTTFSGACRNSEIWRALAALIAAMPRITLPGVCLRGRISAKPKRVHSAASSKIVAGAQLNGVFVTHHIAAVALRAWRGNIAVAERSSNSDERRFRSPRWLTRIVKGSAKQGRRQRQGTAGKVTGDTKTESEGKVDQVKGKVQNPVGGTKDALRDDE